MKIDNAILQRMKEDITILLEHYDYIDYVMKAGFNEGKMFQTWHKVYASIKYGDDNQNVAKKADGTRLFKRNPEYNYYPCDTNDNTLSTGLKKIFDLISKGL